ncbi:hypothetical protein Y1Q_0023312 [Alligator mississippiensis]|uniref:Uncharacterized protein n=1 Tax=Alligator mississippiensis TaxID=8496 RepID=A0A151NP12_ALLMI|nr:hypothetical protein Y1Q_0023312 [Alligator mississippiensis]
MLQEIPEGGLGHAEGLEPLLIIPNGLDDMQPPVLAGPVGSEVVGLEAQNDNSSPSSGILEPVINVRARVWPGGWDGGGRCAAAALGQATVGGQEVAACEGARRSEMAIGQVAVGAAGQQCQCGSQQESWVPVVAAKEVADQKAESRAGF